MMSLFSKITILSLVAIILTGLIIPTAHAQNVQTHSQQLDAWAAQDTSGTRNTYISNQRAAGLTDREIVINLNNGASGRNLQLPDTTQTLENSGIPFRSATHEVAPGVSLPGGAGGGGSNYQTITPGGFPGSGSSGSFGGILVTIFKWGVTIASLLAVTMLIVGGIQYMGSDSIFAKDEGKKRISHALGGLLIALTCVLMLGIIFGFGGGGAGGTFEVKLDF